MRERACHFGGDMRIESRHNGTQRHKDFLSISILRKPSSNAREQASTPNPTTRRCLSRSGLRGGSLWLERISILYENSHRRRQRMGPTRRLEYLGAEDPLGSL